MGTFTCGPTAGSSAVKLRHTSASTGVTISSAAFTARCADNPYTYTASTDKAAYVQGEIGTLTVQFLDSKGNKANSVIAVGASTLILPMLTLVTATGAATGAAAGAAGIMWAQTIGTVSYNLGFQLGLIAFTSAVLGGIGNLWGAVVGGLLIGLIQGLNDGLPIAFGQAWSQSVVFTILIIILVFKPAGLLGKAVTEKV